jgi:ribosomal protein S18 acetylase RimI-like enzyme
LATDVLVYRVNGKIIGFITIKVDGKKGSAPLLAVNIDYEGIGVSFALMRAAETVLVKHGCTSVLGGTQDLNQKTLKITERYGFKFQKIEYVYHLWNKK